MKSLETEELEQSGDPPRQVAVRECSAMSGIGIWESLSELHEMLDEKTEREQENLNKDVKLATKVGRKK